MTQTFDKSTRTEAPIRADEVTALRGFLDYHRDTFRWKCAGLTQEQLAQPLAPTTMTLGGMMKHLALVEAGWFLNTMVGEPDPPPFDAVDWDADPDWEWRSAEDDSPEELRALYDDCVRRADEVIDRSLAGDGLDTESVRESKNDGPFRLRWIMLHMIEEYARHNGHADLLRESIDGQTGE
ncbi:MAG TPA: DinB family protein [Nocardioides sp.]|uniref:DinB family protein n=1 Tax=Nocardioides sp. TaxID=35761 RepID=UPI002F42D50D